MFFVVQTLARPVQTETSSRLAFLLAPVSLLVIVVTLPGRIGLEQLATMAILVVPPVHMCVQLRGTCTLSAGAALWRTAALLGVAGTTFLVFLSLIVVVALR
jgi:hypothetical protein